MITDPQTVEPQLMTDVAQKVLRESLLARTQKLVTIATAKYTQKYLHRKHVNARYALACSAAWPSQAIEEMTESSQPSGGDWRSAATFVSVVSVELW